ncbi:MAG: DUF1269 domain-containing protein [Acidimicrobiales bacterium]|nr:DUF1269 domain-containing protein [Acidimicrobiales bacterium]
MPTPQAFAAISFPDGFRATEFATSLARLESQGHILVRDAVFVIKDTSGKTYVRETTDLQVGSTALGGGLWSGLFGLLLGGPVGLLVGGAVGAGAGALTAKAIDLGVPDATVDQIKEIVAPGTTTVAVLASHIDRDAVLEELKRFEGAEYVWGTLDADAVTEVQQALGE